MADDLFASSPTTGTYDASSIEVLEGLEPVRRRPGMYVGGTDERALHHLAAEVLDNAMDEAVAGHATRIEVTLEPGNRLTVVDNGRGIPVDPHPKFPDKSALEVILSTLHSGGKFAGKAYATSGGLHGVGVSVVNALSSDTVVEVARDRQLYRQRFSRGLTLGPLEKAGRHPEPAWHVGRLHARYRYLRTRPQLQAAAAVPARAVEGVSVRGCRDPLALRAGPAGRRHARRGGVPVPRRAGGSLARADRRPRLRDCGLLRRVAGFSRCGGWRVAGAR